MNDTGTAAPRGLTAWMLLMDGILLVLLAAIVIIGVDPATADTFLIRTFGVITGIIGVFLGIRLWAMTKDRDLHPMLWLTSIVPIVLGVILIIWPMESQEALRAILAILLLIRGIVESSMALSRRTNSRSSREREASSRDKDGASHERPILLWLGCTLCTECSARHAAS